MPEWLFYLDAEPFFITVLSAAMAESSRGHLDRLDRRMLYELDLNSRRPFAQIAKRLKSSPETVRYRYHRLVQEGIVRATYAIVDTGKLGFVHYKLLLKLQSVTEEDVDEMVKFLLESKIVLRLMRYEGAYDLGVIVKVSRIEVIDSFVVDLVGRFSRFVRQRALSVNVWSKYFPRSYLIGRTKRTTENAKKGYGSERSGFEADALDQEILSLLSEDSRLSAAIIAERVEKLNLVVSASQFTILQRIHRLEKLGIITGYGMVPNYDRIGFVSYKVLLFFDHLIPTETDRFLRFCEVQPNIVHVQKTLGEWDYEVDLDVAEPAEFRRVIMQITREFPRMVRDYLALEVSGIHRYKFLESRSFPS